MDVSPVNSTFHLPVASAEVTPQKAAENRSLIQAVKALNGTEMFGQDNHLAFQRDPETKQMVIQVINQKTHEVVLQIPSEDVLRLAEELKHQEASATPVKFG
jgi:uncharacterized FlaG/YvyC family protein